MGSDPPDSPARGIDELSAAVRAFCDFVEGLPDAALAEKAWGPKEVLAHLVFWQESYLLQAEAILAGVPPQPPRGRFDDLNALVVQASRGVPVAELLRRYRAVHERLRALAQAHDPDTLRFALKAGSAPRPLAWFVEAEAGHIRHHLQALMRQAARDPAAEAERLRRAVDGYCRYLRSLPATALMEEGWGPKQVLAHLVFWHEAYLAQLEACCAGSPARGAQGRQRELNAQAVSAARGVPVEALLERLQAADERLRALAVRLDPQDTLLEVHYGGGRWRCTLDDAMARIEAHVRGHLREARSSPFDPGR